VYIQLLGNNGGTVLPSRPTEHRFATSGDTDLFRSTFRVVQAWHWTARTPVGGREMRLVQNVEADGKQSENYEYNQGNPETFTFPAEYFQVLQHWYSNEHT